MQLPWQFTLDINGDSIFSISDVFLLLKKLCFLPGDTLFYFIPKYMPSISSLLENISQFLEIIFAFSNLTGKRQGI